MSQIIKPIIDFFANNFSKEFAIFIIAMLPLIELRGSIPIGVALGIPMLKTIKISYLGSTIPAFFIVFLIGYVFNILRKIKFMDRLITKINDKTMSKKDQIEKYGYLGLILFVGIPIPGTGAWSGSLLAHLLDLKKGRAVLSIAIGNALAALIMATISGAIKFIF